MPAKHHHPGSRYARNQERWAKLERAKHHLLYTLLRLGLPLDGVPEEKRFALQFNFLADPVEGPPVLTGHKDGLITMNIAEVDDLEREQRRMSLQEPYRTLLGHFRHEVGHYYWDRLIGGTPSLARFRELFGDETQDYAAALKSHYAQGPLQLAGALCQCLCHSPPLGGLGGDLGSLPAHRGYN